MLVTSCNKGKGPPEEDRLTSYLENAKFCQKEVALEPNSSAERFYEQGGEEEAKPQISPSFSTGVSKLPSRTEGILLCRREQVPSPGALLAELGSRISESSQSGRRSQIWCCSTGAMGNSRALSLFAPPNGDDGVSAASSLSPTLPLAFALSFALSLAFAFSLPLLFACSLFLLRSGLHLDGSSVYLLARWTQTVSETTEEHNLNMPRTSFNGPRS